MPNIPSAAKRMRQNEKRRIANKSAKTELKSLAKNIQRSLTGGDKAKAEELLRDYHKQLDQAAAKGLIHRNQAARRKSRTTVKVNKGPEVKAKARTSSKAKAPKSAKAEKA